MIAARGLTVMIKRLATCVAATVFLACGPALAQDAPAPPQSTLKLTNVVMALPAGTPWFSISFGLFCLVPASVTHATGAREPQPLPPYTAAFNTELQKAGLKPVADDDLFNREDAGAADYQVAAVVTDARIFACAEGREAATLTATTGNASGTGSMNVEWQLYSPLKKEVVARVNTTGDVKITTGNPGGVSQLLLGAFASNVRALAANADFRTALNSKTPSAGEVLQATAQQDQIALPGSLKAVKRPVADALGSVVTLETGSGSGSGVLLSEDGYILTNAHVVGDEKEVRVRWSDGIEKTGQVVRVSKPRDVALVKTDPRGRPPLPIQKGAVTPGQRVYAIGSPNGAKFAGTVSSGVISASRTINGFAFIQSDVSVSPGSSGGALLDENGALLGITEGGFDNGGRPAGLNIFIPIGDAVDFLNLVQN